MALEDTPIPSSMANTSKTKTSVRTTTTQVSKEDKPPKGAKIIESNVETSTEEIQNGWLVIKSFSGRYALKDDKDTYGHYFSYNKKWYSKTNPLTIKLNDKFLADAFDDESTDDMN